MMPPWCRNLKLEPSHGRTRGGWSARRRGHDSRLSKGVTSDTRGCDEKRTVPPPGVQRKGRNAGSERPRFGRGRPAPNSGDAERCGLTMATNSLDAPAPSLDTSPHQAHRTGFRSPSSPRRSGPGSTSQRIRVIPFSQASSWCARQCARAARRAGGRMSSVGQAVTDLCPFSFAFPLFRESRDEARSHPPSHAPPGTSHETRVAQDRPLHAGSHRRRSAPLPGRTLLRPGRDNAGARCVPRYSRGSASISRRCSVRCPSRTSRCRAMPASTSRSIATTTCARRSGPGWSGPTWGTDSASRGRTATRSSITTRRRIRSTAATTSSPFSWHPSHASSGTLDPPLARHTARTCKHRVGWSPTTPRQTAPTILTRCRISTGTASRCSETAAIGYNASCSTWETKRARSCSRYWPGTDLMKSVSWNGRTWQYFWSGNTLVEARPPAGPSWTFAEQAGSFTVTTPTGGWVTYTLTNVQLGSESEPYRRVVGRETGRSGQSDFTWVLAASQLSTSPYRTVTVDGPNGYHASYGHTFGGYDGGLLNAVYVRGGDTTTVFWETDPDRPYYSLVQKVRGESQQSNLRKDVPLQLDERGDPFRLDGELSPLRPAAVDRGERRPSLHADNDVHVQALPGRVLPGRQAHQRDRVRERRDLLQ